MNIDWMKLLMETGKDGVFFVASALAVGVVTGLVGLSALIAQPMAALTLNTALGLLVVFFLARIVRTYLKL